MASGYCPTDCADFDQVGAPTAGCNVKQRKRTIDRIGFFKCDLALPAPATALNIQPLLDDSSIVFSPKLRNVVLGEPEYEDLQLADTVGVKKVCTKRTITAEDVFAIEITGNKFFDYDFYKDKKDHTLFLRNIIFYEDGSWIIPEDVNGNPMQSTFNVHLSGQKLGNNGGTIEFKNISIDFPGDPLDFVIPYLNAETLGLLVP